MTTTNQYRAPDSDNNFQAVPDFYDADAPAADAPAADAPAADAPAADAPMASEAKRISKAEPLSSRLFRERSAPVVCYCTHADGVDKCAVLAQNGTVWRCARFGFEDGCNFKWLAKDVLAAPLPKKTLGFALSDVLRSAHLQHEETFSAQFDGDAAETQTDSSADSAADSTADSETMPQVLATIELSDADILDALNACGFDCSHERRALKFGRYVLRTVPMTNWSKLLLKAQWPAFKPLWDAVMRAEKLKSEVVA